MKSSSTRNGIEPHPPTFLGQPVTNNLTIGIQLLVGSGAPDPDKAGALATCIVNKGDIGIYGGSS